MGAGGSRSRALGRRSELRGRRAADHIDLAEPTEIELLGVRVEFRTAFESQRADLAEEVARHRYAADVDL
jgi:hypothetical protein